MVEVFATYDAEDRHHELRVAARAAGVDWHHVDEQALASLTETVTPQGVVAVCRFIDVALDHALARTPSLVALCANVRDPGNAGTVIRCADAAGADAVILAGESVDPYNGKAVRASAGSLFHLPIVFGPSVAETVDVLHTAGLTVLAADGGGDVSLDDARRLGRPHPAYGVDVRQRGVGDRTGRRRTRRPHRARAVVRPRREPQPRHRRRRLPLHLSARATTQSVIGW